MVHTIERVKEDTDVVVALDRQRMLTQTMAKAAMGYVLAKSGSQSLEQQVRTLDAYLTQLERTLATQSPPSTPPPPPALRTAPLRPFSVRPTKLLAPAWKSPSPSWGCIP